MIVFAIVEVGCILRYDGELATVLDLMSVLLKLLLDIGKSVEIGNSMVVISSNWVTLCGFKAGMESAVEDTRADMDAYFAVVGDKYE